MNGNSKTKWIMVLAFWSAISLSATSFAREIYTFQDANLTITGAATDTQMGRIFATGDLDGDGAREIIIGSAMSDYGSRNSCGVVYIFRGNRQWHDFKQFSLSSSQADIKIVGASNYEYLGRGVAAGDVDGDGFDDLLIGVEGKDFSGRNNAGCVYVFKGGANFFTTSFIDTASIPGGVSYYTIKGASAYEGIGTSVATGDYNHDGRADIFIGAAPFGADGVAYSIISGSTFPTGSTKDLASTSNFSQKIEAAEAMDTLGAAVASGDLNADGYDDFAIGATMAGQLTSKDSCGRVYIFWGSVNPPEGETINLKTSSPDILIKGRVDAPGSASGSDFDNLGGSLAIADVNGDGKKDLIAGASEDELVWTDTQNDEPGFAYVFFGKSSWSSVINLTPATPGGQSPADLTFIGAMPTYQGAGHRVAAGDFSGDGIAELAILACSAERTGFTNESGTFVIQCSGLASGSMHYLADAPDAYAIYGGQNNISSVMALGAGDINGDGRDELLIGAPFYDEVGKNSCGGAWMFQLWRRTAARPSWTLY